MRPRPSITPLRRASRRGMSLLEVMVAISIVLVMSVFSMSALSNAIEMKDLLAQKDEVTRSARVAMGRLRRELQLAFLTDFPQAVERYHTVFVGIDDNPDTIFFSSFAHQRLYRNARECDQTSITVWTEDADEGPGYTLWHREAPRVGEEPDEGGPIQPLAHNVRSFNLRYLDPRTNEWLEEWDNRKPDTTGLPRAVQIGLVLIAPDPNDADQTIDVPFLTTVELVEGPPVQRRIVQ